MQRVTNDCDRCLKKDIPDSGYYEVDFDRQIDGAGYTRVRVLKFDLCPTCQRVVLDKLLETMSFKPGLAEQFTKLIGRKISPV